MKKKVSSANNLTLSRPIACMISPIYNRNNKGPNTDPCGTPHFCHLCYEWSRNYDTKHMIKYISIFKYIWEFGVVNRHSICIWTFLWPIFLITQCSLARLICSFRIFIQQLVCAGTTVTWTTKPRFLTRVLFTKICTKFLWVSTIFTLWRNFDNFHVRRDSISTSGGGGLFEKLWHHVMPTLRPQHGICFIKSQCTF